MARYDFQCLVCRKVEEREIDMDRILEEKNKQTCSCGGHMIKLLNKPSGINLCGGMYGTGEKGWNK